MTGQSFSLASSTNKNNWNIVESGARHHIPNPTTNIQETVYILQVQGDHGFILDNCRQYNTEDYATVKWNALN